MGVLLILILVGCGGGRMKEGTPEAGPTSIEPTKPGTETEELVLGDFEGALDGWEDNETGVEVAQSNEHAVRGQKSLIVKVPAGPYPGIRKVFENPQDWSKYQVLKLSIFNPGKETALAVRIDDAESTNYETRYNLDSGQIKLTPGANEVEIAVGSMRLGTMLSRGLDVSKIKMLCFFRLDVKEPETLYVDNVRVERKLPRGSALAGYEWSVDLASPMEVRYGAQPGCSTALVPNPLGIPNDRVLQVKLSPESEYPGVVFTGLPSDWHFYHLLQFDMICPEGESTPDSFSLKVMDDRGGQQTFATSLKKGLIKICLPIEMASFIRLGHVNSMTIFTGKAETARVFYIENIRLVLRKSKDLPNVRTASEGDPFRIEFSGPMLQVGRNTCFMCAVRIPCGSGDYVVRCNSSGRGVEAYSISEKAWEYYVDTRPIVVWACFSDHGIWHWARREIERKGKEPVTVQFADPKEFAH